MKAGREREVTKKTETAEEKKMSECRAMDIRGQGFRPPHFSQSQDLAWLPAWLQLHHHHHHHHQLHSSSKLPPKDFTSFQANEKVLSKDEGRHHNYCLFVSQQDQDDSLISLTPSPPNVLQFHLHLSSDAFSQCTPSQLVASDASQAVSDFIPSMQQFESSVARKENTRSKMSCNGGGLDILPGSSNPEPFPQYPANNMDSPRHCGEFNVRYLRDAEIDDAVELSIAASEALVIREIVNSSSNLETLVAADLLEVALRVKQARLEQLEDAPNCFTKETDKHDSLTDLDDFTMVDAFEDVGLSCNTFDQQVDGSSISHVKETPAPKDHYGCVNHSGNIMLKAQQVHFDDVATKKQFEDNSNLDAVLRMDLPLESFTCEMQKKLVDDPIISSNTNSIARENDNLTPKSPCVVNMIQMVDSSMVDLTSSQTQTKEKIAAHDTILADAREDKVTYLVSERFRSRWLGGWTTEKEVDASVQLKQNNAKSMLKAFIGETSFLSESADIFPDENSLVQIRETKSPGDGESQSSIAVEGFDEANKGMLVSLDVVRSSSTSLVDPLCSVVPCSISLKDAKSTEAQNQNNTEIDTERHFKPRVELEMGNSWQISSLNVDCQRGNGQVMHVINDGSEGIVRRQQAPLRTYSVLFPNNVSTADVGSLHYNQSFQSKFSSAPLGHLAFNQNMSCIGGFDGSNQLPLFNSVGNYFAEKENEENFETRVIGSSVENFEKQKTRNHETARGGGGLLAHSLTRRIQPLPSNHMETHHLQASKPSIFNSCGKEHPKQASGPEDVIRFQQSKKLKEIRYHYKNSDTRHFSAQKRVHFSEALVQIKPNKNVQELDSSKRNYHQSDKGFLNCCSGVGNGLIFQSIRFMLTGFSSKKAKEIKGKIEEHGGIVLSNIPSPPNSRGKSWSRSNRYQLPIILSSKKQQTAKFLYGCAVNAFILNVDWITDSLRAGFVLAPEKYVILPWQNAHSSSFGKQVHQNSNCSIFNKVGIMLHGKRNFCTKLAKIVKHGGGQVFKTLQWLVHSLDKNKISVGAIITEDDNIASRQLRQCACERQIPMMPASWIIKSLYTGTLVPFTE